MNKEEIIELLKTLEIEEIKSLKLVYYTEKYYGFCSDNRTEKTLTIEEKQ